MSDRKPGRRGKVHIGASGWHYNHWVGPFYPPGTAGGEMLEFYVRHFRTVEVNNTFYRLPSEQAVVLWRDQSPYGFLFACKASRYITHMKKLRDPEESLALFMERMGILREKLGPVLFQLPPRWRLNPERLGCFLKVLSAHRRYALEFRDASWFDGRVYRMLSDHGAAFCIYDLAGVQSPREVTSDFVYLRLHGPGEAYRGRYGPAVSEWAGAISGWLRGGKDVYCYFDNDECGYAVQDALRLRTLVEKRNQTLLMGADGCAL